MGKGKTFKTYSQQLDSLINDKGLLVDDREAAIETLKHISYFALISGYKTPFRAQDADRYLDGVRFEDIVSLYNFDTTLSALYLSNLLAAERHLKSVYGYHFGQKYGEQQAAYLNESNYNRTEETKDGIHMLVGLLKSHVKNEEEPHGYIEHYNSNYSNVPIWVLMHSVTFGELARLYEYAQPDLKAQMCTEFPSMRARNLSYVLGFLMRVRNNCAHTEPLYTLRTREYLPVLGLHNSLGLVTDASKERKCKSGQNDPFAALVALRYFVPEKRMRKLVDRIDAELKILFSEKRWITEEQLLHLMGFPDNWREVATAEP